MWKDDQRILETNVRGVQTEQTKSTTDKQIQKDIIQSKESQAEHWVEMKSIASEAVKSTKEVDSRCSLVLPEEKVEMAVASCQTLHATSVDSSCADEKTHISYQNANIQTISKELVGKKLQVSMEAECEAAQTQTEAIQKIVDTEEEFCVIVRKAGDSNEEIQVDLRVSTVESQTQIGTVQKNVGAQIEHLIETKSIGQQSVKTTKEVDATCSLLLEPEPIVIYEKEAVQLAPPTIITSSATSQTLHVEHVNSSCEAIQPQKDYQNVDIQTLSTQLIGKKLQADLKPDCEVTQTQTESRPKLVDAKAQHDTIPTKAETTSLAIQTDTKLPTLEVYTQVEKELKHSWSQAEYGVETRSVALQPIKNTKDVDVECDIMLKAETLISIKDELICSTFPPTEMSTKTSQTMYPTHVDSVCESIKPQISSQNVDIQTLSTQLIGKKLQVDLKPECEVTQTQTDAMPKLVDAKSQLDTTPKKADTTSLAIQTDLKPHTLEVQTQVGEQLTHFGSHAEYAVETKSVALQSFKATKEVDATCSLILETEPVLEVEKTIVQAPPAIETAPASCQTRRVINVDSACEAIKAQISSQSSEIQTTSVPLCEKKLQVDFQVPCEIAQTQAGIEHKVTDAHIQLDLLPPKLKTSSIGLQAELKPTLLESQTQCGIIAKHSGSQTDYPVEMKVAALQSVAPTNGVVAECSYLLVPEPAPPSVETCTETCQTLEKIFIDSFCQQEIPRIITKASEIQTVPTQSIGKKLQVNLFPASANVSAQADLQVKKSTSIATVQTIEIITLGKKLQVNILPLCQDSQTQTTMICSSVGTQFESKLQKVETINKLIQASRIKSSTDHQAQYELETRHVDVQGDIFPEVVHTAIQASRFVKEVDAACSMLEPVVTVKKEAIQQKLAPVELIEASCQSEVVVLGDAFSQSVLLHVEKSAKGLQVEVTPKSVSTTSQTETEKQIERKIASTQTTEIEMLGKKLQVKLVPFSEVMETQTEKRQEIKDTYAEFKASLKNITTINTSIQVSQLQTSVEMQTQSDLTLRNIESKVEHSIETKSIGQQSVKTTKEVDATCSLLLEPEPIVIYEKEAVQLAPPRIITSSATCQTLRVEHVNSSCEAIQPQKNYQNVDIQTLSTQLIGKKLQADLKPDCEVTQTQTD
ncbi:unnamed protein product, partial [Protopolystoma xenopodis]